MLEELELQILLQTRELLLETIGPEMRPLNTLVLWNQLRIALLISLVVFITFLQRLSFSYSIRSRYPTFRFFILFTEVLLIPKASVAFPSLSEEKTMSMLLTRHQIAGQNHNIKIGNIL
jgi:hypothetical protein